MNKREIPTVCDGFFRRSQSINLVPGSGWNANVSYADGISGQKR